MPQRTLVLTFAEDTPYHGAEVRCRASLPLRDALAVDRMRGGTEDEIQDAYQIFGEHVVLGWNLVDDDDDGEPIPYTVEAWLDQPYLFLVTVVTAWKAEMYGVPAPLPSPSPNGPPLAEPDETTAAS